MYLVRRALAKYFSGSVIQSVLDRQHRGQFNLGKIGPLSSTLAIEER